MTAIKATAERLDGDWHEQASLADSTEYVRICYYGDPGSGKTTASAYLAHVGPTAFFPVEPGLKKTALSRLGVPLKNIHLMETGDYDTYLETYWRLQSALRKKPGSVAGVVFDSATEMVARTVADIRNDTYNKDVAKAESRGEEMKRSRFFTDRAYYGDMTSMFRDVMSHFVDLPCHLVYTAHVRRDEDGDGETHYGPAVTPAVQADLVGYLDIIMRVTNPGVYKDGGPVIVGRTGQGGKYIVKDRFGVLPTVLASPTMDRVVAYVNGDLTVDNDPIQKKFKQWESDLYKAPEAK